MLIDWLFGGGVFVTYDGGGVWVLCGCDLLWVVFAGGVVA